MITDYEVAQAITTGVLSGVLSATILWIFHKFFVNVFSPWLESKLYRGVIISGTWTACYKSGEHYKVDMTMRIRQKAYTLFGTFEAKTTQVEQEYINQYSLKGRIADNYAMLEYSPLSRSRIGLGTFVLRVTKGGKQLKGSTAFLGENNGDIGALEDVLFEKQDSL